jgi:hypothetical protein
MQVFPTAPSPTVTHLMNLEALEAIETNNNNNNKLSQLKYTLNKLKGAVGFNKFVAFDSK